MANTAYALSIELQLKGNLQQQLQSISTAVDNIEIKAKQMVENLSKSLNLLSSGISANTSQINKAIVNLNTSMKDMQKGSSNLPSMLPDKIDKQVTQMSRVTREIANGNSEINTAVAATTGSTKQLNATYKISTKHLDEMYKLMYDASKLSYDADIESIDASINAYDKLQKKVKDVQKIKETLTSRGMSMDESAIKVLKDSQNALSSGTNKQKNLEISLDKIRSKWRKATNNGYKSEILSKKEIKNLSSDQLRLYQEYVRKLIVSNKMQLVGGELTDEQIIHISQMNSKLLESQRVIEGITGAKEKTKALKQQFGELTDKMKGFMGSVGLGGFVQMATAAGVYEAAIEQLIKREEKFHEIQFRGIGSMVGISRNITKVAKSADVTSEELENATVALREFGANREEIDKVRIPMAQFQRITGGNIAIIAKFGRGMRVATKDETLAVREMEVLTRRARLAGLSGNDLNQIMQAAAGSALHLGMSGSKAVQDFNRILAGAGAGAKKLGIDVSEATNLTRKLLDPMADVAFLGQSTFGMTEMQRMELHYDKARESLERMNKAREQGDLAAVDAERFRVSITLGINPADVEKEMSLRKQSYEEMRKGGTAAIETEKDLAKATQNLNSLNAETIEGGRARTLLASKTAAIQQDDMEAMKKAYTESLKAMNSNVSAINNLAKSLEAIAAINAGREIYNITKSVWNMGGAIKDVALSIPGYFGTALTFAGKAVEGIIVRILATCYQIVPAISSIAAGISSAFSAMVPVIAAVGAPIVAIVTAAAGLGAIAYYAYKAYDAWKVANEEINKTKEALSAAKKKIEEKGSAVENDLKLTKDLTSLEEKRVKAVSEYKAAMSKSSGDQLVAANRLRDINAEIMNTRDQLNKKQDITLKNEMKAVDTGYKLDGMSEKRYEYLRQQALEANRINKLEDVALKSIKPKKDAKKIENEKSLEEMISIDNLSRTRNKELTEVISKGMSTSLLDRKTNDLNKYDEELFRESILKGISISDLVQQKPNVKTNDTVDIGDLNTAVIEPIVTAKITPDIGKPVERSDETLDEMKRQNNLIEDIKSKLDVKSIAEITKILKRYLPQMAEDKDTGLASTANQWVN